LFLKVGFDGTCGIVSILSSGRDLLGESRNAAIKLLGQLKIVCEFRTVRCPVGAKLILRGNLRVG
jgi:hypothetical protein